MKLSVKWICLLLALLLLAGCAAPEAAPTPSPAGSARPELSEEEGDAAVTEAERILRAIREGQSEELVERFSPELKAALTAGQLQQGWESVVAQVGRWQSLTDSEAAGQGEGVVAQLLCQHEGGEVLFSCTFNGAGEIAGLFLQIASMEGISEPQATTLPEGVTEMLVALDVGEGLTLSGSITLPAGEGPFPAVVLVQGSGSSDMDETIGANKPFRDIAYGLAARGVASIRYDKMSYAHPEAFSGRYTVDLEYTASVLEALKTLKENASISSVYCLGHSLGGMLTPYFIEQSGGGFAGGIILAGSPRKLWEIVTDQNRDAIAGLPEDQRIEYEAQIAAEVQKAQGMAELRDDELDTLIFGMPAFYLRRMEDIDSTGLARQAGLPLLILQGEADFQVSMERDFEGWKEILGDLDGKVTYRSYPGLNHLFMKSGGEHAGTVVEYNAPGQVEGQVVEDIANWILAR